MNIFYKSAGVVSSLILITCFSVLPELFCSFLIASIFRNLQYLLFM
ncbi:hypothetical protein ABID23_000002 [Bartonella silvatica]|uniref:Lipoprotein n=1 Tax=Bartonella silvatica TaxID=357760 RepID=A0ABV2HET5_9HYPH